MPAGDCLRAAGVTEEVRLTCRRILAKSIIDNLTLILYIYWHIEYLEREVEDKAPAPGLIFHSKYYVYDGAEKKNQETALSRLLKRLKLKKFSLFGGSRGRW